MKEEWKGLNLVDLMDLLEPVPEPEPVSMMPQTAGWYWLGGVFAVLVVLGARHLWRHWQKNAYRRQALAELDQSTGDPTSLATLVRRTALAAFPRQDVASLHGKDWLDFLDKSYGGTAFTTGPGRDLATAPYRQEQTSGQLKDLVRTWIRDHRGEKP